MHEEAIVKRGHQENVEALILPDWSDHVVVDRGVLFKA